MRLKSRFLNVVAAVVGAALFASTLAVAHIWSSRAIGEPVRLSEDFSAPARALL